MSTGGHAFLDDHRGFLDPSFVACNRNTFSLLGGLGFKGSMALTGQEQWTKARRIHENEEPS